MSEPFDPYRKWLGIPEGDRPPSHYQLLGLSPHESDPKVIHAAGVRQSGYVRQFQTGRFSEEATRILNEIASAQVCLLNLARRAALDSQRNHATQRNVVEVAAPTAAPRGVKIAVARARNPSVAPAEDVPTTIPLAPLDMEESWNDRLPAPRSAGRQVAKMPSVPRPLPRSRMGSQPWTDYILRWPAMKRRDRRLVKKGATLVLFGMGLLLLPHFGLEFRRFHVLADALSWCAFASGVVGLILLLVALRRDLLFGIGAVGGLGCLLAGAVVDSPINPVYGILVRMERDFWADYGAHGAVRVVVRGLPNDAFVRNFAIKRLHQISGASSSVPVPSGSAMRVSLAPVDNLQELAARIDFGDVTSIDTWTKTIHMRADPSRLPAPLGPEVFNFLDSRFYPQNIADLTCADSGRRKSAAERLAKVEPNEWQPQVVAALEKLVSDSESGNRKAAIDALSVWGTGKYLDVLLSLLDRDDYVLQVWASEALVQVGDPRAVKPLCDMLVEHGPGNPFNCLLRFGKVAEPTLLDYLHHRDDQSRNLVIRLLGEIGTQASIAPLTDLVKSENSHQPDNARSAIEQIRWRMQNPN